MQHRQSASTPLIRHAYEHCQRSPVPRMRPVTLTDAASVPARDGDCSRNSASWHCCEKRLNLLTIELLGQPRRLVRGFPCVLRESILASCDRVFLSSLWTVCRLASNPGCLQHLLRRVSDRTVSALGALRSDRLPTFWAKVISPWRLNRRW